LKFAGAAQSLGAGAILVNPWNVTEVAAAIARALKMPSAEREKRHKHNFLHVTSHTAQEWAGTFVRYAYYLEFVNSCPVIKCEGIKVAFITYCSYSKKKLLNHFFSKKINS